MGKNSAEYMRAYRARRKAQAEFKRSELRAVQEMMGDMAGLVDPAPLTTRIAELEDEVRRLKQELAGRLPEPATYGTKTRFTSERASQQAERDAILRKVNNGG